MDEQTVGNPFNGVLTVEQQKDDLLTEASEQDDSQEQHVYRSQQPEAVYCVIISR